MVRTSKRGQALLNIWSSSHGLNLALCEHTATLWKSESPTQKCDALPETLVELQASCES